MKERRKEREKERKKERKKEKKNEKKVSSLPPLVTYGYRINCGPQTPMPHWTCPGFQILSHHMGNPLVGSLSTQSNLLSQLSPS
jgi:hypothetical protein